MIALVVGVIIAVAIVLGGWRRFASGRAERRSVERYEEVLGRLGGVTKRSDTAAPVNAPSPDELAQPHIRPAHHHEAALFEVAAWPSSAPPIASIPPSNIAASASPALVFNDEDAWVGPTSSAAHRGDSVESEGARRRRRSPARLPRSTDDRRGVVGLAAVLVLVVLGATAALAVSHFGHPKSVATPPATSHRPVPSKHQETGGGSRTAAGYVPVSVTKLLVSYAVPSGAHRLGFSVTGRCWIGVETSPTGPYLWMDTLAPGQHATFDASGSVTVRIGAPTELALSVDGVPVELPPGNVNPFDVVLGERTAAATPSSPS